MKSIFMHIRTNSRLARFASAIVATCFTLSARPIIAQRFSTLYTFPGFADGAGPQGIILDNRGTGNLYGVTDYGGIGSGVVFQLSPPYGPSNETVLFSGGSDGAVPNPNLIQDTQGNLYGTTYEGGMYNSGVVFKLDPSGNYSVLYTFTGGADGGAPGAGVILDNQGSGCLYGTTLYGGNRAGNANSPNGAGVVFKLDPSGNYSVLYTFSGGSDGANPFANVIQDAQGNLYGTTWTGGYIHNGVVFKLDTSGNYSVLYSFAGSADGSQSAACLIQDAQGNLYGTTVYGGDQRVISNGYGVVFKLAPSGHETLLHTFTNSNDGAFPYSALTQDARGNLYGTTYEGGKYNSGVVFKLDPSGNETVMHTFTGGADGGDPFESPLIQDTQGNLYGTTSFGGIVNGQRGSGVVFKIYPYVIDLISVVPSVVTGGNPAIGTVTLSAPSPPGGALVSLSSVSLSSRNTATVQVPAIVTVAQGQTSATFPITTFKVNGNTFVTITGDYNDSRMTTLIVTNCALKAVEVKPGAIQGGQSAVGTVFLTKAAPANGSVVSLSSSDPAVTVPASVTVSAGQKNIPFIVTTTSVSKTTKVTISATYGGTIKTATLTVKK